MEKKSYVLEVRGVTWQEIEREVSGRFNHIRRLHINIQHLCVILLYAVHIKQ